MKSRPSKTNYQGISSVMEKDTLKKTKKKSKLCTKAVKTMAQQLIKPPARVWDKIQAILDEQDNRRNTADNIIASSFGLNTTDYSRKKVY